MHSPKELAELADVDVEVIEEAREAADRLIPTNERDGEPFEDYRLVRENPNIIQDILAHPKSSPTNVELMYLNPTKNQLEVTRSLEVLVEAGLIKMVNNEHSPEHMPSEMYTLTMHGIEILEEHDIFITDIGDIRDEYNEIKLPDYIIAWNNVERPDSVDEIRSRLEQKL